MSRQHTRVRSGSGSSKQTPAAPTGLTATPTGQTTIHLDWDTPYSGTVKTVALSGWKVYRSTTSGSGFALRSTVTASEYDDTAVVGTRYYYKVTAVGLDAESAYSTEVSAITQGDYQAPAWTIPDLVGIDASLGNVTKGGYVDLTSYYSSGDGTPVFSIQSITAAGGSDTSGITIDSSTGRISVSETTPADSYAVSISLTEQAAPVGDAEADWLLRSGGAGVVWAHDFRSYSEVSRFSDSGQIVTDSGTVLKTGMSQDPLRADPNTYETANGYHNTFALLPGETPPKATWPSLIDGVGSGALIIDYPKPIDPVSYPNGYPDGTYYRWGNSIRAVQVVLPDGTVLPGVGQTYSTHAYHRFNTTSGWYRPLAPLTGATNGKGVDDPAANGTLTRYEYPSTSGGVSHITQWEATPRGYWAHPSEDPGNGSVLGNEFWLQLRVWVDPREFMVRLPVQPYTIDPTTQANRIPSQYLWDSPFNPYPGQLVDSQEAGKLFMLARKRELTGEWIHDVGVVPSTYLNPDRRESYKTFRYYQYTMNGAGYPAITYGSPARYQTNPAHSGGYHDTCYLGSDHTQPNACWEYPEGEWFTIMIHFKPGRTNVPYSTPTNYDSLVEIKVARWGETNWTYVFWDDAQAWFWNTSGTHPKGISDLRLVNYRNDVPMWAGCVQAYTQVIFSTQEIPCPQVY